MKDKDKTKERLMEELDESRRRIAALEDAASRRMLAEDAPRENAEPPRAEREAAGAPVMEDDFPDLGAIIDVPTIQALMDDFYALTHMALAILDLKGTVLIAIGWQDICTRYHRTHPQAALNCTESDLFLAQHVRQGEFVAYKCKNQLWDVVTPLYVGGKHVGNIYTGQFFYEDETLDEAVFIAQADRYGFDRESYLRALRRVPRYSRDRVDALMHFLTKLSILVSELSYRNQKLARAMSEQQRMAGALRASENLLRATFNATADGILVVDNEGGVVQSNARFAALWRIPPDLLEAKDDKQLIAFILDQVADPEGFQSKVNELYQSARDSRDEIRFKDGRVYERFSCPVVSEGREVGRIWDFRDITVRTQADEALRASEAKYRLLHDSMRDAFVSVDMEGRITDYNDSYLNMIGYGPEEISALTYKDITPARWHAMETAIVEQQVLPRGYSDIYEKEYRRKDGTVFPVELRTILLKDDADKPARMWGIVRDITERKRMEDTLRESERKYRDLYHYAQVGLFETSLKDARVIACNQRYCDLAGFPTVESALGMDVLHLYVNPADREEVKHILREQGSITNHVLRLKNQLTGRTFWAEFSARLDPVRDIAEGTIIDITERRQAEEALRDTEERFRLAFNTSPDSININRLEDGLYIDVNEGFTALTGFTREDAIGKTSAQIDIWRNPDDRDVLVRGLQSKGYYENLEAQFRRKNGSIVTGLMSARIIMLQGVPHILSITRDISVRRQAEEALRRSQQEYRNLFENAVVGIFRSRLDGSELLEVNQALCDLFGYTREEMLTESVAMRWADPRAREEMIKALNKDGTVTNYEADLITKRGEIRQCLISLKLYPQEGFMEGITIDITARKLSEKLLRESEERYRLITDNITDIVFTTDSAGAFTFISPSHQRLLAQGEEVLGQSIFEHIHPEDIPGVRAAFDEAVRSRGIARSEYRYLHPSRGYIWLESEGRLIDMQGTLAGIIVARDITSRKLAEESLRESEERFRQLFQSMVSGFALHEIICDDQGTPRDYRFLEVNPAFEQLTGLKGEAVVGRTVCEVMPDIEPYWIDLYGRVALTGNPMHFENFSGNLNKYFEVSAYSPRPGQFAAVFLDITERKRAEERLMNQMEFVSTLLNTIPSPIFYKDVSGKYLGCNRAFEDFWGRSRENIIGKRVHDIGAAEIVDQYAAMDKELIEQGGHQTYEWKGKAVDGSEKDVIFSKAAFQDSSGNIAGLVGVIIDITERKKAEDEKHRLQAQLAQAQKMESIGTLAGGIAHDFNNILSSVLGFTELAKLKAEAGEDVTKELDEVLKAGIRARDLVKQILMFSRQAEIKREPLDIVPLIKETLKFLRASLPATIEFRHDLAVSSSLVMADPVQIHQILMNLCTNAAHAMKEKGGLLEIRLAERELADPSELEYKGLKRGRYLCLSVTDTGSGIPKEIVHRIFDPFFTTKARGEGTGMGLSVVHGIVNDMGGAISVYSEPGRGTTFNVLLPLYEGGTVETRVPQTLLKTGRGRILFVDDEEGVIVSGRGILQQLGYTITSTTSPVEALALFTAAPDAFDLVLTDMTMPKMTGLELSERLLKIRPDIPIVLCTGFSLGISPERIRDAGIREMVIKPMVASELSEAVYKAMHSVGG